MIVSEIDIIGVLTRPAPRPEGWTLDDPQPAHVTLDGWHVNLTARFFSTRPDLAPYRVTPSTLLRVWAGDDPANPTQTVALRFTDEAEALTYFPAT